MDCCALFWMEKLRNIHIISHQKLSWLRKLTSLTAVESHAVQDWNGYEEIVKMGVVNARESRVLGEEEKSLYNIGGSKYIQNNPSSTLALNLQALPYWNSVQLHEEQYVQNWLMKWKTLILWITFCSVMKQLCTSVTKLIIVYGLSKNPSEFTEWERDWSNDINIWRSIWLGMRRSISDGLYFFSPWYALEVSWIAASSGRYFRLCCLSLEWCHYIWIV